jgi:hypothetical protein|tara:strand:+ start:635 stop:823 length:189 start_codon:yes stop_codon:yes gene_type:complete
VVAVELKHQEVLQEQVGLVKLVVVMEQEMVQMEEVELQTLGAVVEVVAEDRQLLVELVAQEL